MPRKRSNATAGFTIIESLVVLLIIVLLASIVIPGLLMRSKEGLSPKQMAPHEEESTGGSAMAPRDQADARAELGTSLADE